MMNPTDLAWRLLKEIKSDLTLPVGKEMILQADDKKHSRGLLVELLKDKSYDIAYWYGDEAKPYPIEVLVDGKSVSKDAKRVTMKFHPELKKSSEPMDIAMRLLKEDELPENQFHSGREWPNFDRRWPQEWEVGGPEPVISPECKECKRWNRLCADCEVTRKPNSEGGWFPSTELGKPEEYPLRYDVTPEEEEIAETVRQFIIDNTLGDVSDEPMLLEYLATSKDPHPDIHWIDDKKAWPPERILNMPQIEQLKRWAGIDESGLGIEPWARGVKTGEPMDLAFRLLKGHIVKAPTSTEVKI